jgi:hypothetical protein
VRDPRSGFNDGGESDDEPGTQRRSVLGALFELDGPPDLDEMTGPIYWPELSMGELSKEWAALRVWVEQLMMRFGHLDHHVIPRCWYLHNGHVEALAALRDQELVNYIATAPGTAAVDWHRAFRDIEARLREWTGQLACGATHETRSCKGHLIDSAEWERFVKENVQRRHHQEIDGALVE